MRFLQYLFDLLLLNLLFYSTIPTPLNKKVTPECIQFPATEPYSVSQANFLSNIDTLTIPLKRAGKLLLIETHIDGQHGNLIFDTGASNLVLNNTYFRDYLRTESVTPNGITGSLGKIYKTIVDTLKINGLFYHDIKADLADLGHIENRRGVKVLGLLGLNLFRDYEVIINAKHNELKLIKNR